MIRPFWFLGVKTCHSKQANKTSYSRLIVTVTITLKCYKLHRQRLSIVAFLLPEKITIENLPELFLSKNIL